MDDLIGDINAIAAQLPSYWRLNWRDEVTTTQVAINEVGRRPFTCIGAEYQSGGRGRLERSFEVPHGLGLTFTIALSPALPDRSALPLVAGLSLAKALKNLGVESRIKWPNDLLIDDLKVAGILAEADEQGVKLGIGLNILQRRDQLPVPTATSLHLSGYQLDRSPVLVQILRQVGEDYLRWQAGWDWRGEYRDYSATIGQRVEIVLPIGPSLTGLAVDISAQGELVLEDGKLISVGDVVHARTRQN